MQSRYISTQDVVDHLELDDLNETDFPKLSTVDKWLLGAEKELDDKTQQRWDVHRTDNELISPDSQTQYFILKKRPLVAIHSLERQSGDDWDPSWTSIADADYRIFKPSISKIKTKEYFWAAEGLRVSYTSGYNPIPKKIWELALLFVEKRYIMSRMGIDAADSETVSVAVIRIQSKGNTNLKYRYEGLEREIQDRLNQLKGMNVRNVNMGYMNITSAPNKRYRMW